MFKFMKNLFKPKEVTIHFTKVTGEDLSIRGVIVDSNDQCVTLKGQFGTCSLDKHSIRAIE